MAHKAKAVARNVLARGDWKQLTNARTSAYYSLQVRFASVRRSSHVFRVCYCWWGRLMQSSLRCGAETRRVGVPSVVAA
jgi:hypothetical protein